MATIRVKRGTVTPTTANLTNVGELAFDYANNILYARSSAAVVKIGGELEKVFYYEGTIYYATVNYAFSPDYIYKVHIVAATYGAIVDASTTYFYYRTAGLVTLTGSYLSIYADDVAAAVGKISARNTTLFYIQDAYSGGVTLTSGITKVIDMEISPTLAGSVNETLQWVAYGKSVTTVTGQNDAAVTLADFVHSFNGSLGSIYINPGLNLGTPDSIAITIYRTKRK